MPPAIWWVLGLLFGVHALPRGRFGVAKMFPHNFAMGKLNIDIEKVVWQEINHFSMCVRLTSRCKFDCVFFLVVSCN
jgi:hypothetical protein